MIKSIKILTDNHIWKFLAPSLLHSLPTVLGLAPFVFVFLVANDILFSGSTPAGEADIHTLVLYYMGIAACVVLKLIISSTSYARVYIMGYRLATNLRIRLGEHLKRLPMSFFKVRDPGDITALLLQDIFRLELSMTHIYQQVISCVFVSAVILILLALADIRLSVAMLLSVSIALPILMVTQKVVKHFGKKHNASKNMVISKIIEYLHGIKAIKAHNQTGPRFSRLEEALKKLERDSIIQEAIPIPFVTSFALTLETGYMLLLLLGAGLLVKGEVTAPIFLLFLIVGNQLYDSLKRMSVFLPEIRQIDLAGDRIGDVLALKPLPEPEEDVAPDGFSIALEEVTFRYLKEDVLKNVSFVAPEGSITALVGPSGSGKSTIMNLISRFWDVNSGAIRIGGRDVRDLRSDRLLSYIATVFQDVHLFHDTIFNNIRMGRSGATREEVVAAAVSAQCHDFITKLPQGYETVVGEGGATLSGGEKQRISIARAILKNAPIVLLDEATASLDPENEMLIRQAVGKLVKSRTLIVIAHRLHTICKADRIIVLDKGRLVESGRHEQLMAHGGLYARLWREQERASGWKFKRKSEWSAGERPLPLTATGTAGLGDR